MTAELLPQRGGFKGFVSVPEEVDAQALRTLPRKK
jgi:hypothetical protein